MLILERCFGLQGVACVLIVAYHCQAADNGRWIASTWPQMIGRTAFWGWMGGRAGEGRTGTGKEPGRRRRRRGA
ncbi:uncharacterized protein K452DRAFT_7484 [Aplosporella prunicola CBS 121167]|uniref:Secreted protein n=1 Tax=Aplosporella prunicola CBS 121167 TaxID=1176127 RepID=A0A6A6BUE9_9PEZI|nr:uncharacterized protein K452DRAFT_7484 [Aplosporella prunicola CBS 121167]KAF2147438.1 hypothetical protein K452DRAFT_7484 [Aplosporella prunicola CBS 121167]